MADDLNIGPERKIGMSHPCFIVAEIGQNHQGDINIAKQLISAAKASGADCVKFQKSCLVEKFNSAALKRPYLGPNSWGDTYEEHKQFLEFSLDQFRELQEFATRQEGVMFSASAMDMVLERHITLDKSWKGSDHICSLTPEEFKELVNQVRTVELAMGSPVKSFQPNERPCYNKLGKSVVVTRPLPQGHVIREGDIIAKVAEPKGCPAHKISSLVGRTLQRSVGKDQSIFEKDVID